MKFENSNMNRAIDWEDLRYFLAVHRAGSLVGAARLIGSSQPTVGRRIRALEMAVGRKLFQRSAEGFLLSDDGLMLLRYAEQVENSVDTMHLNLLGTELELSGTLRVSSSDWFGSEVLAAYAAKFSAIHPKVSIELVTDSRTFNLNRRETDLAFRIVPFDDPDIAQRKILTMDYAVYTAVNNDDKTRNWSLITMDSQFGDLPDAVWLRQQFPNAHVIFTSNSRQVQANYCATSKALAVLPTALGDCIPGLKRFITNESPPKRDVWIGYHSDLRSLSRLRAFIDFVVEQLKQDQRFNRESKLLPKQSTSSAAQQTG